jgi:hypothetical protein
LILIRSISPYCNIIVSASRLLQRISVVMSSLWQVLAMVLALCGGVMVNAVTLNTTGIPVTVWAAVDTLHKCGFIDVPDIPSRAFVDGDGVTRMVVGATTYHRMSGPSILNQTRECAAAYNSTDDPDPARFGTWLTLLPSLPNRTQCYHSIRK